MPIVSIEIDNLKYDIECEEGEEKLLRESEKLLNIKFDQNKQIKNLSQSKKYLMISLVLAGEINLLKKQNEKKISEFDNIISELENLENLIEKKING
jgi:cell division protein ZapA (FtsZ GTPase activity inhibitor)